MTNPFSNCGSELPQSLSTYHCDTSLASLYTEAATLTPRFPSFSVPANIQIIAPRLRAYSPRFTRSSAWATSLDVCAVQPMRTSRRTPIPVPLRSLHHCIPSLHSSGQKPSSYRPNRPETPNHALQRTAPRVTVAAGSGLGVFPPSHRCPTSAASFFAPPSQLPRHAPPSLSLGSLGVATRVPSNESQTSRK